MYFILVKTGENSSLQCQICCNAALKASSTIFFLLKEFCREHLF